MSASVPLGRAGGLRRGASGRVGLASPWRARAPERRMRRVDLAEDVLLTQSGITRLLQGLERAGLVERADCPTDGRVVYAQLTDGGYERLSNHTIALR